MLISLHKIVEDYNLNIRGVIHIGAHHGQEYPIYQKHGIKNMLFFEPVKETYNKLTKNIQKTEHVKLFNLALGNEIGVREMNIEKVKGQSSSMLNPRTHLTLHPHIKFTDKEWVPIAKLDVVGFDRSLYNMINIDVQGFELEVFKGGIETLKYIDVIYTEVNFEEVYENCCQVEELDAFLKEFGFTRVFTKDCGIRKDHDTWGDALYIRKQKPISFDKSIKSSYNFNINDYNKDRSKWKLLKELYIKNFVDEDSERDYNTLPKKIHQIWLGSDPLPWHTKLAESWKKYNPDWEYKLWRDEDVDSVISDRTLYNSSKNYGQKADILRYHILDQFGGLYIDTDVECLKSFNSLSYVNFLMGCAYPSKVELYNAIIACTPHHPIIRAVIDSITNITDGSSGSIFKTTGPYLFTKKFFEVITEYQKGVLILPTDYLYPFPNYKGFETENGRDFIKDCSYTIHYWELLWLPVHREIIDNKKQVRKF